MADWVAAHRDSITFLIFMFIGVSLIFLGVFIDNEHGLIALGAAALGLPGFAGASRGRG